MKTTARAHQATLYLSQAVPPEIEAGTFISIKVKVKGQRAKVKGQVKGVGFRCK